MTGYFNCGRYNPRIHSPAFCDYCGGTMPGHDKPDFWTCSCVATPAVDGSGE